MNILANYQCSKYTIIINKSFNHKIFDRIKNENFIQFLQNKIINKIFLINLYQKFQILNYKFVLINSLNNRVNINILAHYILILYKFQVQNHHFKFINNMYLHFQNILFPVLQHKLNYYA